MGDDSHRDVNMARGAVRDALRVHVRIEDQSLAPDKRTRDAIAEQLPDLIPFGNREFVSVHAVLDWDHQIPAEFFLLRLYAAYDADASHRVETQLALRDDAIAQDNLYPEFDLPDYGEVLASESYVGVLPAGSSKIEEFRLVSEWRKQVTPEAGRRALAVVKGAPGFRKIIAKRDNDALGGPVVVGWAPPSTAGANIWAVEIWIITAFDGQKGDAHVFMVAPETGTITREFQTTVQVA